MKLVRRGQSIEGTLHLTSHHIIFSHIPEPVSNGDTPQSQEGFPISKPKELWITYPIIHNCTLRLAHPSSHLPSSIRLRCRDFTFVCFCFIDEREARDVYDSIKAWTCRLGRIEKLYAFSYQPPKQEKDIDGWNLYDTRREWKRQGISEEGVENGWRISTINTDYGVCSCSDTDQNLSTNHVSSLLPILLYSRCLRTFPTILSTMPGDIAREFDYLC